jgi:hypothetical protein
MPQAIIYSILVYYRPYRRGHHRDCALHFFKASANSGEKRRHAAR